MTQHTEALAFAAGRAGRRWQPDETWTVGSGADDLFSIEFSTLAGYHEAPEELARFARAELLHLLSHYYHGEVFAVSAARRALADTALARDWGAALEALLADEVLHADTLRRYLDDRGGGVVPQAAPMAEMCRASLAHPDASVGLLTLHLVVEAFGLGSISASRRGIKDPALVGLLGRISEDEAHHLALGAVFARHCKSANVGHYIAWIRAATAAMRASSLPLPLFVTAFPDAGRRQRALDHAMASAAIKRQARFVAATMLRSLRELGWPVASGQTEVEALFLTPYSALAFDDLLRNAPRQGA